METTTLLNPPPRPPRVGFLWFLSLYCLALAGAYILASETFPITIGKDKIFGIALTEEQSFNRPLFIHLSVGVFFIAFAHLLTRLLNVRISTGNSILAILLILNIFCFVLGINIPLLHTTKLWVIKEHLSLTQVLTNLKLKGEMQIFYIMLVFTFVIPILKMIAMANSIFISKSDGRKNLLLSLLSKWAMLDVMVVGIIISTMKSGSGFAEMNTGYGLIFFVSSVLLSMIICAALPFTKNI